MTVWAETLTRQPLFAICLTIGCYAAAEALWRRTGRPAALNPVLVATTLLAATLLALGLAYEDYLRQARLIDEALGFLVVLLAVPLCRQFPLIRISGWAIFATLLLGSIAALATALAAPALVDSDAVLVATIAPKSSTAAVAVEISKNLGGIPGLTAVIVISTGVFGAAFGPALLDCCGVRDHRALGFALGVASHGIGAARAFQISETAGAFASLGMILNALLTIALAPVALQLLAG